VIFVKSRIDSSGIQYRPEHNPDNIFMPDIVGELKNARIDPQPYVKMEIKISSLNY
jgi:hypothetical protein